ncbi:MAG: phytoene/squalene synthase family protein [Spirochaetia bacterium]
MNNSNIHSRIFKEGSKTYFNSSAFFPEKVREDVYTLYGFVRVVDNYVDAVPQQNEEFYHFKEQYYKALGGKESGDVIIDSFIELAERKQFSPGWTEAFFASMEMDLTKSTYNTLEETLEYIYGSAEVIGLFMARILELDLQADEYAKMLGRAMQYINFIRDINEDVRFGRTYLPTGNTGFLSLSEENAKESPDQYRSFIRAQIDRFFQWQDIAEKGFAHISKRYLVPIKTASDMYKWTAAQIRKDPFIVYRKKVKPSKPRIIFTGLCNFLTPRFLLGT